MAENGASSSQPHAVHSAGPKAIGSLAKKPSDLTRQGTQKLKFVPTLPARRKKEEAKQEALPSSIQHSDKGNGRGRGRGRGRGGEGKGAAPRPPPVEMTASGPFAMGPALAGTSARRGAPRSNLTPIVPQRPSKAPARENPLVDTSQTPKAESNEDYSEPDEGVEIIDMENVWRLDWMAPETLRQERRDRKKRKRVKTETEEPSLPSASSHQGPSCENVKEGRDADPSNALNLSESEEEEELQDLMEDFAIRANIAEEGIRQERMYFFQFPEPFPTFVSTSAQTSESTLDVDVDAADHERSTVTRKVDGMIGQLEVYRSGTVRMRLGNGIVLHVSEATQPSFLQQAVYLDMENEKLHVLGEVNKRFVVSPDLGTLLTSIELSDARTSATAFDDTCDTQNSNTLN